MTTEALINDHQDNEEDEGHSHPQGNNNDDEIEAISPIAHVGMEEDAEDDDGMVVVSSREELHMLASSRKNHPDSHAAKTFGSQISTHLRWIVFAVQRSLSIERAGVEEIRTLSEWLHGTISVDPLHKVGRK